MAIIVTCPGCHKSFSVRDEFGGRKGPCPKCKTMITIPMPDKKVTVHGGEAFSDGGKSASGQLVLKPIKRRETIFKPKTALIVASSALVLFLLTWLLGGLLRSYGFIAYAGLILVTPALVYAPWFFLRDTEAIEELSRQDLILRTGLCSAVYLIFWTAYIFFAPQLAEAFGSMFSYLTWPFAAVPLLILGGLIASFLFDLEFGDGFVHVAFYVLLSGALFWTAGLSLVPMDERSDVPETIEVSASADAASAGAASDAQDSRNSDSKKKGKKGRKEKEAPAAPPVPMRNGKPVDPRSK